MPVNSKDHGRMYHESNDDVTTTKNKANDKPCAYFVGQGVIQN